MHTQDSRRLILHAGGDPPPPTLVPGPPKVSSRLMSDYRLAAAVTGESDLVAARGSSGEVELAALGTDGVVYNLRRSHASDTGWEQASLGNAFPITSLALAASPLGAVVFGIGIDEANPEIHFAMRSGDGAWSAWLQVPLDPDLPPGLSAARLVAGEIDGRIALFAFLAGGPEGMLSLWQVPWDQPTGRWQYLGDASSTLGEVATFAGTGTGILAFAPSDDPTTVDLVFYPAAAPAAPVTVLPNVMFTQLSVCRQASGFSGIFLYNESWIAGTQGISFLDAAASPPALEVVDTTTVCSQILAVDAGRTPSYLLALDQLSRLVVLHRVGDGWSAPLVLGLRFGSICSALDARGLAEVFGFDGAGQLQWLAQEGSSTDDPTVWIKEPIDLPLDRISEVPSFVTSITLLSEDGNVMPFTRAELFAGEVMDAAVGGESLTLGPDEPVMVESDARGVITVSSRTESLSTAKIRLKVGATVDRWIQRNAATQDRLRGLSEQEVADLLPAAYRQDAPSVFSAVEQAASLTGGQAISARSASDRLDPAKLPEVRFRFRVEGGRATFTPLTAAGAAALCRPWSHLEPVTFDSDFWSWLGDLFESAADAVTSAFEYVVNKVEEGVEAVITCVVNGVTYVFSGIIQLVEEAFSLVEAVFNSVAVFFERLYSFFGWLLEDAAADIWRTKQVIESTVAQVLPILQQDALDGAPEVMAYFTALRSRMDGVFRQALAAVGDDTLDDQKEALSRRFGLFEDGADVDRTFDDNRSILDWLLDKLLSPLGGFDAAVGLPPSLLAKIESFLAGMTQLANDAMKLLESELAGLTTFFERVAQSPGDLVRTTARSLIIAVQQLADWVIDHVADLARQLVELMAEVLAVLQSAVLDRPIDGPFVEGLYNLLNPGPAEKPTLLGLAALLCAFPSTILFRLITGRSPFSESDVEAVRSASDRGGARLALGEGLAQTLGAVASFAQMAWALVSFGIDVSRAELRRAGRREDIFRNVVLSILFPMGILVCACAALFPLTGGDSAWIGVVVLYGLDLGLQLAFTTATDCREALADIGPGQLMAGFLGVAELVTGLVAAVVQPELHVSSFLLALFPALPNLGKLLLLPGSTQLKEIANLLSLAGNLGAGTVGALLSLGAIPIGPTVVMNRTSITNLLTRRRTMSTTQQDPTFQAAGKTRIYMLNRGNAGFWQDPTDNGIAYSPATTPPWTEGEQWQVLGEPGSTAPFPETGAVPQIEIEDRSNDSVLAGSTYAIWFGSGNAEGFRPRFEIHGVQGGSIIRPGIDLWNLLDAPNQWTTVMPQAFEGTWAVSWINPWSITPVTVTIGYVPGDPTLWNRFSRLWYSVESVSASGITGAQTSMGGPLELVGASSPHETAAARSGPAGRADRHVSARTLYGGARMAR